MHKEVFSTGLCEEWYKRGQHFSVFHQEKKEKNRFLDSFFLLTLVIDFSMMGHEKNTKTGPIFGTCDRDRRQSAPCHVF